MPISDLVRLRVAAAQINPLVGDISGNSKLILASAAAASKAGVQVLVFPEMIVTGYPVEDLALRKTFRIASIRAITDLAISLNEAVGPDLLAAVGYLDESVDGKVDICFDDVHDCELAEKNLIVKMK